MSPSDEFGSPPSADGHLPTADWTRFRAAMPIVNRFAYFDHAAVSPLSRPAQAVSIKWAEEAAELGDTCWPQWQRRVEEIRTLAASLIGAEPVEIALIPNTTAGINIVAEGFPWRSGDNVVVAGNEFPSNLYPWMNLGERGVQARRVAPNGVELAIDQLADACDSRTRLIAVSWVGYSSGWRIDLDELVAMAHQRGCLVFLDAIQGLGVFPLDVKRTPVDFLAADGHKWLLGPEGAGLLFLRSEHLSLLRPLGVGWNSVVHAHDFSRIELQFRRAASRYEGGSRNTVGCLALGASLELLATFGLSPTSLSIAERVLDISGLACQELRAVGAQIVSDRSPQHASGIVSFQFPNRNSFQLRDQCRNHGVVLSCRGGFLRISPHAYNDEEDIRRLVTAITATA